MRFFLLCILLNSLLVADVLKPQALQKGDLIALVYPASFLSNRNAAEEDIEKIVSYLENQGYQTILYPEKVSPVGDFAGEDEMRAKYLMDAWKNPEVRAIWCIRGGWGSIKIANFLDHQFISHNPKIFLGMSDITSLHHVLSQKTDLVTFLSPVLTFFLQNDFEKDFAFEHLESICLSGSEGPIPNPCSENIKVIKEGVAQGRLTGGNLCLLAASCGTSYQIDAKGKILILEDVEESPYRIDRMLWQLKNSGVFSDVTGVILGDFTDCDPGADSSDFSLEETINRHFKDAPFPVLWGIPTGHCNYQATIPMNVEAKMNTYDKSLELLESSVK